MLSAVSERRLCYVAVTRAEWAPGGSPQPFFEQLRCSLDADWLAAACLGVGPAAMRASARLLAFRGGTRGGRRWRPPRSDCVGYATSVTVIGGCIEINFA